MKKQSGEAPRFFFEDAAAVQRLHEAFAKWDGTPFRQNSKAAGPGGGIDCVGFVEEAMGREAGVDRGEPFAFPRTSADYQSHRTEARVLMYLRGEHEDPQSERLAQLFAELTLPPDRSNLLPAFFLPGDLVALRRRGMFHLLIMLDAPRFMHCAFPYGVAEGNIHDPTFSTHIDAMFRARGASAISNQQSAISN